jgi:dinuclear metal center YbgI/SA1388 family protein
MLLGTVGEPLSTQICESMTITLNELAHYTDHLLDVSQTKDYPHALNGVQLENRSPIRSITAAVDFSTRAIHGALAAKSNLLVVHHGMFWGGLEPITGAAYRRVRTLVEGDVAVYASHLPLDCHPELGNNSLLAKELSLEVTGGFARFGDGFIGLRGEARIPTAELLAHARKFAQSHGGDAYASVMSNGRQTRKWAMCTGAGASAETLKEASVLGIDTMIVGEGPHWTAVHAEENDLVIIYAGHYATETLGVRALARHLGERFDLPWQFVSAPTGF